MAKDKRPDKIKPMLSSRVDHAFDNEDWLFETKWDGFRAIADIRKSTVRLLSRNSQSFNDKFPAIIKALQDLHLDDAIFDGEIVVLGRNGKSTFQALQNYPAEDKGKLRYYIFDLLYYKQRDLRHLPLIERKGILQSILKNSNSSTLQFSPFHLRYGIKAFAAAKKKKIRGNLSKRDP